MGKSYNNFFGLEMIINVNNLKYKGQCPRLIQALAMLIIKVKQLLLLIIHFRIFHEILSSPGADELLYLLMAFLNSSFEKGFYMKTGFEEILSNILILI